MDIHEYQAKQLLSKFGVSIPPGEVVYQTHEAENIVTWLNEDKIVVKAQIHAGGRGKAGGIKICKNDDEVIKTVDEMIGMKLITPQTSESGKIVRRVYLEKGYERALPLYTKTNPPYYQRGICRFWNSHNYKRRFKKKQIYK